MSVYGQKFLRQLTTTVEARMPKISCCPGDQPPQGHTEEQQQKTLEAMASHFGVCIDPQGEEPDEEIQAEVESYLSKLGREIEREKARAGGRVCLY